MTAVNMDRFTPEQRERLTRLDRAPWRWFISNRSWWALVDEYSQEADRREYQRVERERESESERQRQALEAEVQQAREYWRVLSRCTGYTGPDYRVRLVDGNGVPQKTMIRAYPEQYRHAVDASLDHEELVSA